MRTGKLADGVAWWLAGWRPGPRPAVGTAVTLAASLAAAAFWGYLPTLYQTSGLVQAIDGVLLKLGMQPDWRPVLYALCLIGALGQVAIAAVDLFAPAAVRVRAASRAGADAVSALFAGSVVLGFGLDPREAFGPGVWIAGWMGLAFCVFAFGHAMRALANLRQAIYAEPHAAAV